MQSKSIQESLPVASFYEKNLILWLVWDNLQTNYNDKTKDWVVRNNFLVGFIMSTKHEPKRIYHPIKAMGFFSVMFTFQLDNTKR